MTADPLRASWPKVDDLQDFEASFAPKKSVPYVSHHHQSRNSQSWKVMSRCWLFWYPPEIKPCQETFYVTRVSYRWGLHIAYVMSVLAWAFAEDMPLDADAKALRPAYKHLKVLALLRSTFIWHGFYYSIYWWLLERPQLPSSMEPPAWVPKKQ